MQSNFQDNSIYFVEADKIKPNPFQPRREFDSVQLDSLSDSIRMYGVLQPLVVTRKEVFADSGGMSTEYELIAGERRLRASKLAGLREVPVIIRSDEQSDREKLEVAIIENLQREDLNPVDRAIAFRQLVDEFKLKHAEVAKKVGKSREYVSNTMRILALPEEMLQAITDKKMTEGHARTLLMLTDRPEEQVVLFKEIILKKLTVRAAEKIARRVAFDKVRKKERTIDPHTVEVEDEISETLGTRVHIERKAVGGKIEIDFFSEEDLAHILKMLKEKDIENEPKSVDEKMNNFVEQSGGLEAATNLIIKKEKEAEPEKTTVKDEIFKTTPYSYIPKKDPEEDEVTADDVTSDEAPDVSKEEVQEEVVESHLLEKEEVVEESSQYEPVPEVDVNKLSEEVIANTPPAAEPAVDVNKLSEEVIANTPPKDNDVINDTASVSVSSDFMPEKTTVEEAPKEVLEQPRSKYLEKIEPEDMGKINVLVGDAFLGDRPTTTPVDTNQILEEREELGFTQPNVITDFVENEKEKEEISTPNYGNN